MSLYKDEYFYNRKATPGFNPLTGCPFIKENRPVRLRCYRRFNPLTGCPFIKAVPHNPHISGLKRRFAARTWKTARNRLIFWSAPIIDIILRYVNYQKVEFVSFSLTYLKKLIILFFHCHAVLMIFYSFRLQLYNFISSRETDITTDSFTNFL